MVKNVKTQHRTRCKTRSRRQVEDKLQRGLRILIHKSQGIVIRISDLVRTSKTSRSTFYRHYRNINELMIKTETQILQDFRLVLADISGTRSTQNIIFLKTFVFIRERRDYFQILFELESHRLIVKMMQELQPLITRNWTDYGNSNQVYHLYSHQVATLISHWCKNDKFSKHTIDYYVSCIAYITKNTNQNLRGLPKKSVSSKKCN